MLKLLIEERIISAQFATLFQNKGKRVAYVRMAIGLRGLERKYLFMRL